MGSKEYSMGEKSLQKKEYILEKARQVFAQKGYRTVTMKDIVDACEISRGGLYLYFDSTKELFQAVLQKESQETDDIFSREIGEDATAADILTLFLKEQKKELLRKKDTLMVAIYEFFFENQVPKKENMLHQQFDAAVKVLEILIKTGIKSGEFICENPKAMARNIMFVLEGLKIAACTMGITEEMVNDELVIIMQGLVKES